MKKEFDKIVRTRRSVRKFKNVDISDDKVKNSILHASLAPNLSLIHI